VTDHRGFLKHFLPCTGILRAFLLAGTGNVHDAEDLLQEVSSVLLESFERYDDARPFRAWAIGIAKLEVLKWRQKKARARLVLSEPAVLALAEAAIEAADEADARRSFVADCLARLGASGRECLTLRYWDGLSTQAIATRLGKSVAAIEMALVRSRRALESCVARKAQA
jgi:RNA polymerase sigma-70 factor (ECF subfamily)